jgi:hypothetical protein
MILKIIILFDYIFVDYKFIFYIALYVGNFFYHAFAQDVLLHTFIIFIAVNKGI